MNDKEPTLCRPPTAIIYSRDYEPISHIPMNDILYDYFMKYEIVKFPVVVPVDPTDIPNTAPVATLTAELTAIKVLSNNVLILILVALDDSTALLMNNTFLPGQTKELNYIKTTAFYKGMIKAIREKK